MDLVALTRALVDIESVTGNEAACGRFLRARLEELCARFGGVVEEMAVEPGRVNLFAQFGTVPVVTLSTHYDTVPPFFASREDEEFIWGRGACDTKGIIASMFGAAERLLAGGGTGLGLLFVVGEERNSIGAYTAAKSPRGSRYLINGEPTENQLALGSKGALRYELIARGRMAHSAYPELGESAVLKLLDCLERLRRVELPVDEVLGASTMNIGTIAGGRAPNVIPDEARAELLIRLVGDSASTLAAVEQAAAESGVEAVKVLEIPAVRLRGVEGVPTTVVAYTTDIPAFGGAWGEPLLLGPGTIHVAHTSEERIAKRDLAAAVDLYQRVVKDLWRQESK